LEKYVNLILSSCMWAGKCGHFYSLRRAGCICFLRRRRSGAYGDCEGSHVSVHLYFVLQVAAWEFGGAEEVQDAVVSVGVLVLIRDERYEDVQPSGGDSDLPGRTTLAGARLQEYLGFQLQRPRSKSPHGSDLGA
jgi:hypothetical protein